MNIANEWKDYKIIDMADGQKLEKWGNITLIRPDPQIIWKEKSLENEWKKADAVYNRSSKGGGEWKYKSKLPKSWTIKYKNLTFNVKPMGFKHTGVFPEQAVNWDWMINKLQEENKTRHIDLKNKEAPKINVLNLFAYTGAATVACLYAGAKVTHVDSSKGMCQWAKENVESSGLKDKPVRFLIDDVIKFVNREIRRGNKYDAIIMDPPSYGRGSNGEVWKFEDNIYELVKLCMEVLSDKPLFFLVNSYTTGISAQVLENILRINFEKKFEIEEKKDNYYSNLNINSEQTKEKIDAHCENSSKQKIKIKGTFSHGEIGLPMENSKLVLPCGIYARFE